MGSSRVVRLLAAGILGVTVLGGATPAAASGDRTVTTLSEGSDTVSADRRMAISDLLGRGAAGLEPAEISARIDAASARRSAERVARAAATAAGARVGEATRAGQSRDLTSRAPRNIGTRTTPVPSPDIADYAIVATNSIDLKRSVAVQGSVAVNSASTGVTLVPPFELALDQFVAITGDAAGDSVFQNRNGQVSGSIFNNEIVRRVNTSGMSVSPLALPVVAPPPFLAANVGPGTDGVSVGVGAVVRLPAGTYGSVNVAAGGTLVLEGGIYNLASLTVGASGAVRAQQASDVRVAGRANLGANSYYGPDAESAITAANLILYVAGANGGAGGPAATPAAAAIGQSSTFHGTVYAPNGTVVVGQSTTFSGAAFGRDVRFEKNGSVTAVPFVGIGNQPPTADAQTVYTEGATTLDILLTGSDPEFENLTFSIVSGPTKGTLGAVTHVVPAPIPNPPDPPVQPPIVSAEVTYTPANPSAEEEDEFTFRVTDSEGLFADAVVSINPPDDATSPPPVTDVAAADINRETIPNTSIAVDLASGASGPDGAVFTFTVESLPVGTLADSGGTVIVVGDLPYVLPTSVVTYTPPSEISADDFTWSVAGTIGGSASASVFITISAPPDLAPDVTVGTSQNTPVKLTLPANPGGTGQATGETQRVSRTTGVRGAAIAGNVSDANADGLGDGRDNLPGPAPVLIAAGVDVNLGATPSGNVTDPAGDATNSTADDPANPDLVSGSASSDGTNMNFTVAFVAAGFSSSTSRASFVLDTDENPATGFPGVDAANNDSSLMGVEYLVNIGANLGANAEVLKFVSLPNNFTSLGTFPATVNADGYSVAIPLSTLGGDDGRMTFKVETQSFLGPGFTGILDYMPNLGLAPGQAKTGVQGVARIEIEWDISDITDADSIESAQVTLTTEKGTVDSLDTFFYVGTADQDGTLTVSDFQTPAGLVAGAVMPVPAGPTGTQGSFTFNVTRELKAAVTAGFDFFTIQGRVNETLAGGGFKRGLQIRSTATGNLTAGTEPKLDIVVGTPPTAGLVWTVLSLPANGVLKDTGGTAITVGQSFTVAPLLVFQPNFSFVGSTGFNYSVAEGTVVDNGLVTLVVDPNDNCIPVGRPPACAP